MPAILLEAVRVAWMPADGALHGPALDSLMRWNLLALVACFLIAHLWLLVAILRRRKPNQAAKPFPKVFRSLLLAALCVMYAWMAITAQHLWAQNRFAGAAPAAMQVEVVGQQFQWYFRYPGTDAIFGATRPTLVSAAAGNPLGLDPGDPNAADDIVSSILVLPAGREVDLRLRSLDVIHGFFIPGMRLKQNAVPGLILHIHFTPTKTGTYPILCSQVCGLGHERMQASLQIVSPADFSTWLSMHELARKKASGEAIP
jgi:cytochrome c oxidase subunit II